MRGGKTAPAPATGFHGGSQPLDRESDLLKAQFPFETPRQALIESDAPGLGNGGNQLRAGLAWLQTSKSVIEGDRQR
jgi:hypothetical protein